ncbi:thermonuclease family protein [Brevibacillus parabrevis]|uniref:thermonuclease family protein n=1 Tax=Brevibacillus parabrevis TaxID=54914 RepID=UPI002490DB12|nr:thermonuclease family protein [Brevibacillus parabrevis]
MKFLKFIGWVFIPYIMILFQWKKIGAIGKGLGTAWALIVLISSIGNAASEKKPVQTVSIQENKSTEVKQKEVAQIASQNQSNQTPTTDSQAVTPTASRIQAKVLEVTDGDTIKVELNGKEAAVRFLLVDTPETKHPQHGEQPFGKEASNFTKDLLSGKTVELEQDVNNGPDKYGRLLYYIYVEGKSVQEMLLEKGLARVAYIYAPNVKYVDQYKAIQEKAQKEGLGIWSVENYAQEDGYHPDVIKKNEPASTKAQTTVSKPKENTQPAPVTTPQPVQEVYYANCSEAKAAGAAPLYRGEPGYRAKLDRDNDGVACEK